MRSRIISSIALAIIAAFVWVKAQHTAAPDAPIVASADAPDFSWQALDGTKHTLAEYSGNAVVLHFWASWCAPCRAEFPELLKAASTNKDIIFLTISSDEDKQKAEQFIHQSQAAAKVKEPANVLYAFDPQKNISFDLFQSVQYPETILLDAGHHLRRKFPGPVDWNSKDIQNDLKQLQ